MYLNDAFICEHEVTIVKVGGAVLRRKQHQTNCVISVVSMNEATGKSVAIFTSPDRTVGMALGFDEVWTLSLTWLVFVQGMFDHCSGIKKRN